MFIQNLIKYMYRYIYHSLFILEGVAEAFQNAADGTAHRHSIAVHLRRECC
jgi:hypothetical protein